MLGAFLTVTTMTMRPGRSSTTGGPDRDARIGKWVESLWEASSQRCRAVQRGWVLTSVGFPSAFSVTFEWKTA